MKKLFILLLLIVHLNSCEKHLFIKEFKGKDFKVIYYQISLITSVHAFLDIERDGKTTNVFKASTNGIYHVIINDDTVIVQTERNLTIYKMLEKSNGCYIKHEFYFGDTATDKLEFVDAPYSKFK